MATRSVVGPANFNLAVESLMETLRLEKSVSTTLSHTMQAVDGEDHLQDDGTIIADQDLGSIVDASA